MQIPNRAKSKDRVFSALICDLDWDERYRGGMQTETGEYKLTLY